MLRDLSRTGHAGAMPRRSPRRPCRLPADLFDYVMPTRSRVAPQSLPDPELTVTDDWPEIIPITEAELRVFEAQFGNVLDEIFGQIP